MSPDKGPDGIFIKLGNLEVSAVGKFGVGAVLVLGALYLLASLLA